MLDIFLFVILPLIISAYSLYGYIYLRKDKKFPIDIFGQNSWVNCRNPIEREQRKNYMLIKLFGGFIMPLMFAILAMICLVKIIWLGE
jgi:hypothetical protein